MVQGQRAGYLNHSIPSPEVFSGVEATLFVKGSQMASIDASRYYSGLLPKWEQNYPSTTALQDAWDFYHQCGWEDAPTQLAAPLRTLPWDTGRVLDYGCDTGVMLQFFAQQFPQTTLFGVDINRSALRQGRALYPELNLVESDGLEIPFRDGFFDLIFLSAVLKHIRYEDRAALFAEFSRVARYLYVVEVHSESQRTEEQHGFTFYYSDFRVELGALHRELHYSRAGSDFLALYDLSLAGSQAS